MMYKAYKYRLSPTDKQKVLLEKHFGSVRYIYNWGLSTKIKEYEVNKKSISCFSLIKIMTSLKKELIWLKEINSQSLQMSLVNLDNAFKRFFREKKGFPNFKSKHKNNFSFQIPQNSKIKNNRLIIPKFKEGIKIILSNQFNGKIKTITIKKTPTNKYFACVLVELNQDLPDQVSFNSNNTIGIDFGMHHFLTLDNGTKFNNPLFLKQSLKAIKKYQKKLSKKIKGSNNRKKARLLLALKYEKLTNQRTDFLNKLSSNLINDKQINAIAIENLSIQNMLKSGIKNINRNLLDLSWYEFTRQLEYKALWKGKTVIKIGRFEPSSKLCNSCGIINNNLKLTDRTWECPNCHIIHDRDILAANNIKTFALQKQNLIGQELPKSTLVEI